MIRYLLGFDSWSILYHYRGAATELAVVQQSRQQAEAYTQKVNAITWQLWGYDAAIAIIKTGGILPRRVIKLRRQDHD